MKIALAQINTTVADFEGNSQKILQMAERAAKLGADLVVYPELTLCGYPPRDLVEIPSFIRKAAKVLDKIAKEAPPSVGLLVGTVAENTKGGGKPAFNRAVLLCNGKIQGTYDKSLVPNYDVFEEGRYFEPGVPNRITTFKGKKIGISICEDIWNDKLFWTKRLYKTDPIEEQVALGAELLINISASPYAMEKEKRRHEMLQAIAIKHGVPIAYVNLVGANDELVFDGLSLVLDDKGRAVAVGKQFEEDLLFYDLSKKGEEKPIPDETNDVATASRALVVGVHDYVKKCGFKKVVLGLSGGIDSSLVATIAVEALGAENVVGVLMPSPYTSRESIEDASQLAKNLGIESMTIPITEIFESYKMILNTDVVGAALRGRPNQEGNHIGLPLQDDATFENIQARIRGNILMALSNRYGYLVLSTGNKSELGVGYCTLYGDMSGGLAVISDLPKTVVYPVARHFNQKRVVIPERVFTKAPTAELRPNQKDQDSLPPYETLDLILKNYIEEHKGEEEIVKLGFDKKLVADLLRRVDRNEYKRRQAAPGIKITAKAFGMGRRFPIARKT
ncbi:MAG: NAD+ synthase [Deltaproteobacteria bacterium]|nr:NAD+ synthase [Deltaproteobacteria bacterium]